jgi:hypothetical protein
MKITTKSAAFFFCCWTSVFAVEAQTGKLQAGDYPIQPVLFNAVNLSDNFWAPRIKTNHEVTIPFTLGK